MLKAKIKIIYLKLNSGEFNKALVEALETQNRQAARAWLRAVITKVPVFTGEARGSLRPLGQFLKVAIPITPSTSQFAQRLIAKGQNEASGEAKGHFEFKVEAGRRFVFMFSTEVVHYLINEFYEHDPEKIHLIEPTPWHSLRAGKEAYDQYLKENLKNKIPKIKSYIIRETGTNI